MANNFVRNFKSRIFSAIRSKFSCIYSLILYWYSAFVLFRIPVSVFRVYIIPRSVLIQRLSRVVRYLEHFFKVGVLKIVVVKVNGVNGCAVL